MRRAICVFRELESYMFKGYNDLNKALQRRVAVCNLWGGGFCLLFAILKAQSHPKRRT